MLCDSIEAASRTLKEYTPEAFDAFVERIVASKMKDGQFEDADISIKELGTVKDVIKSYLQQMYHERVETMLSFVAEEDECRSRYLLRYFGQEESADCGKCDICRERAKHPQDLATRLKAFIKAPYTLDDIRTAFGTVDTAWLDVLRELIDNGEVPPYES